MDRALSFADIYLNILDTIRDEVYIYDYYGCLQYLNKAAEQAEGFILEKVKGKSMYELYDFGQELRMENSPCLEVLRTGRTVYNAVCTYYSNKQRRTVAIDVVPIYQEKRLMGAYCIQKDMTQMNAVIDDNIELQGTISQQKKVFQEKGKPFSGIIGNSYVLRRSIEQAQVSAKTDSPIMLIGRTGSGKEVFARAIHESSSRAGKTFLAINCAAIPENLLEGILFGTTKGVYTGALDKEGLLVKCNGGTLFLDEINSMPVASQAKLLRVLEERKVRPLGSNKETTINVRFISSINENPEDAVSSGHMRADFFYRLAVLQVKIPSLKDRLEDIPELTDTFIRQFNEKMNRQVAGLNEESRKLLLAYDWPGNVRQLKACIESAMNFARDHTMITPEDLPDYVKGRPLGDMVRVNSAITAVNADRRLPQNSSRLSIKQKKLEKEKLMTVAALEENDWNVAKTARAMGISRQMVYKRIKKYNDENS